MHALEGGVLFDIALLRHGKIVYWTDARQVIVRGGVRPIRFSDSKVCSRYKIAELVPWTHRKGSASRFKHGSP